MIDLTQTTPAQATPDGSNWHGMLPTKLLLRLAAQPRLGAALYTVGETLIKEVDRRRLELIALRVSAVRGCQYVWRGHCRIALRLEDGPLTAQDIARVAAGPTALADPDRSIVRAVDDLLDHRVVDRATRERLGEGLLGLMIGTLFYDTVATLMHGEAPEPDAVPVAGIETPARARQLVGRASEPLI
jgi:AhpD family alkylhydroperoxidase